MKLDCILLFLTVAIGLATVASAQEVSEPSRGRIRFVEPPDDLNIIRDVIYKTVDGQKLDMWIFPPVAESSSTHATPLVLMIHGGGWGGGHKSVFVRGIFLDVLRELTSKGITCASIEYRLANGGNSNVMHAVGDCLDAAAYLVEHAKDYNLDPSRFGTFGGSAGGHLSMMTVLAEPKSYPRDEQRDSLRPTFRCCVSYFGSSSMLHPELFEGSNFARPQRLIPILGGTLEDKTEEARLLSPIELLHDGMPPLLLIHGEEDKVLSVKHSVALHERAQTKHLPVEIVTVKNADHGFRGENIEPSREQIVDRTVTYLIEHLD